MTSRVAAAAALAALILTLAPRVVAQQVETDRLTEAARVLDEVLAAPDKGVPESIIEKAQAVVVIPSTVKGALIIGAQRGKGVMSAKSASGWSAPAFVTLTGGSVGFQIGGSESEVVMLVMNKKGMDRLLSSKFTLGGDATIAAGPVGRNAQAKTDATMRAEILSYSRSRGVFAKASALP